jgi:hypothetical protein
LLAGILPKKSAVQRGGLLNDLDLEGSKEADKEIFDVINWLIEH